MVQEIGDVLFPNPIQSACVHVSISALEMMIVSEVRSAVVMAVAILVYRPKLTTPSTCLQVPEQSYVCIQYYYITVSSSSLQYHVTDNGHGRVIIFYNPHEPHAIILLPIPAFCP